MVNIKDKKVNIYQDENPEYYLRKEGSPDINVNQELIPFLEGKSNYGDNFNKENVEEAVKEIKDSKPDIFIKKILL